MKRSTLTHVEGSLLKAMFGDHWEGQRSIDGDGRILINHPPRLFMAMVDTFRGIVETETAESGYYFAPPQAFRGGSEEAEKFRLMAESYGVTMGLFRTQLYRIVVSPTTNPSIWSSNHSGGGWFADPVNALTVHVSEDETQGFTILPLLFSQPPPSSVVIGCNPQWFVRSFEVEIVRTEGDGRVDIGAGWHHRNDDHPGREGHRTGCQVTFTRRPVFGKIRLVDFGRELYLDGKLKPFSNLNTMYRSGTQGGDSKPIPYMRFSRGVYKIRVNEVLTAW